VLAASRTNMDDKKLLRGVEQPVKEAKQLIGLKHAAYKDYVAARILFFE
jgi:hypothetical protein